MPNGGHLTVETRLCAAPAELKAGRQGDHAGGYVLLRVRDTGRGMDAATLRRALEPFFTTRRSSTGTGLGLAMVHRIVTRAGGHVKLDSALDEGTTVSIFLPISPDASVTQAV